MIMHGFGVPIFFLGLIVLGLIVLGVVVFALAMVLRSRGNAPAAPTMMTSSQDSALTILRERFARGEISQTEYDEMRQILTSS